jgi:hypothetical protein
MILTMEFNASPAVLNATLDAFCRETGWNENQLNAEGQPLTRRAHFEREIRDYVITNARAYRVRTASTSAGVTEGATADAAAATVTTSTTQV